MLWTGVITLICATWWCHPWRYISDVEADTFEQCIEIISERAWQAKKYPEQYTVNCEQVDRRRRPYTIR